VNPLKLLIVFFEEQESLVSREVEPPNIITELAVDNITISDPEGTTGTISGTTDKNEEDDSYSQARHF